MLPAVLIQYNPPEQAKTKETDSSTRHYLQSLPSAGTYNMQ